MRVLRTILILIAGCLSTFTVVARAWGGDEASEHVKRLDRLRADARKLLQEGRYEEAIEILGPSYVDTECLKMARDAQARGDMDECLRYYDAYLQFFPFGTSYSSIHLQGWATAAVEVTEIRATCAGDTPSAALRQDVAAAKVFRQLRDEKAKLSTFHSYGGRNAPLPDGPDSISAILGRCALLVENIVQDFPQSLYCVGAVLEGDEILARKYRTGNAKARAEELERQLAQLEAAAAPPRTRMVLTAKIASLLSDASALDQAACRHSVELWRKVADATQVTGERRAALFSVAWG